MSFSLDKYKFYKRGNDIIAVSTYAGKTVKAYAKCDPRDSYDEQAGKELAAARCNAKIADKREARARRKVMEAQAQLDAARQHYEKMYNLARCILSACRRGAKLYDELRMLKNNHG